MKKTFSLFLMCLMALTMNAQRFAVLDFEAAQSISVTQVDGIADMFSTYFSPRGYTEVDRAHIKKILAEQKLQHSNVTERKAAELGRIMNVSKVVVGKVSMLGNQYQVDIKVVDVQTERVVAKGGTTVVGDYRQKVRALAEKLAAKMAIAPQPQSNATTPGYTDLGLPSGTKWKNFNATGFYTYDEAVSQFGKRLPTKEQWQELKGECQWTWTGNGYKVVGPNGNSIVLPAAGYRTCSGSDHQVGYGGRYWSSTPGGSGYAWKLYFASEGVRMDNDSRCRGGSVRLVQD